MTYLLLALVKGASLLVEGASSIARRFDISDFAMDGAVKEANL